ncbi:MAG: hypothetical protein U9N33_09370 [Campylobacterota bacterium]|nr:hypothetical protein [Campylobacterota bacterium]
MKKFNLFNEIIITDKASLLQAINSSKMFGINIKGEIIYEPFADKEILIYQGKPKIVEDFSKVLGKNYQLVEDNTRVLIKAFSNWQELISINTPRASYDDTTADGVAEFSDKELENIGWHITEFNVGYRELVELLEEKCDGTILCIEQEEPYQFSGLGFLADDEQAQKVMFKQCQNIVKDKLANDDDFDKDDLDDDQEEAARFFKAL